MEKKGLGICVPWIAEHEKLCPYYFIMLARGFYFFVECTCMHMWTIDPLGLIVLQRGIVSIDQSIDQSTALRIDYSHYQKLKCHYTLLFYFVDSSLTIYIQQSDSITREGICIK